ncbi:MAG: hypothetical protein QNJ72_26005 [Pleurocapsa sp. MO_226.B13]|nr:hypothetical protein [Pleurocapsa sp. MO_226.B13]
MVSSTGKLTVKEFFNLPEGDRPYELIPVYYIEYLSLEPSNLVET